MRRCVDNRKLALCYEVTLTHSKTRLCRRKLAASIGTGAQLRDLVIHASPFTRTVQTAHVAAKAMGLAQSSVYIAEELRERYFGKYDLTADNAYPIVWGEDLLDAAAPVPGAKCC